MILTRLPESMTGYELWNNCAHAAAFALCHRVYGGEPYRRLALLIRRSIGLLMTAEGRFLRRLDPSGYPDPRPDVRENAQILGDLTKDFDFRQQPRRPILLPVRPT